MSQQLALRNKGVLLATGIVTWCCGFHQVVGIDACRARSFWMCCTECPARPDLRDRKRDAA